MERKLTEWSAIEIKAAAYDCLATIQATQNQLNALNGELSRRSQESAQPIPESIIPRLGSAQSV